MSTLLKRLARLSLAPKQLTEDPKMAGMDLKVEEVHHLKDGKEKIPELMEGSKDPKVVTGREAKVDFKDLKEDSPAKLPRLQEAMVTRRGSALLTPTKPLTSDK